MNLCREKEENATTLFICNFFVSTAIGTVENFLNLWIRAIIIDKGEILRDLESI